MQQGGHGDGMACRLVQAKRLGDLQAVAHHILGMPPRVAVFGIHRRYQRFQHGESLHPVPQGCPQRQGLAVKGRTGLGPQQALIGKLHDAQPCRRLVGEQGDSHR